MNTFIKICGICSLSDLEQISALGPDALGFVFWPKSKRYIDPATVGEWNTPSNIRRVGVFVNPSESELKHAAEAARLDVLQVHRTDAQWTVDRSAFPGKEFWLALNPEESVDGDEAYDFNFDRFLLDSYDPKTVGGTGKTCDWEQARHIVETVEVPVLLAGGLNPSNVANAIELVNPWGVDVSSGVEIEPGQKDIEKVASFIAAARRQ